MTESRSFLVRYRRTYILNNINQQNNINERLQNYHYKMLVKVRCQPFRKFANYLKVKKKTLKYQKIIVAKNDPKKF